MTKLGILLLAPIVLLASGQQAPTKPKTAEHARTLNGNPVDIDITLDSNGKPTAPDTTLHRDNDDRAHWNNKIDNKDCDVIFSPFGLPNYRISHGKSTTSGPIVGPDGSYTYMIVCGDAERVPRNRKGARRPGDPTIIITK